MLSFTLIHDTAHSGQAAHTQPAAPLRPRSSLAGYVLTGMLSVLLHVAAWHAYVDAPKPPEPPVQPPELVEVQLLAAPKPAPAEPEPEPPPPEPLAPPPPPPPPQPEPPPKIKKAPAPKPRPRKAVKPKQRPRPKAEPAPSEAPAPTPVPPPATPAPPRRAAGPAQPGPPSPASPPVQVARIAPGYGAITSRDYPPLARRRGLQGNVLLRVQVLPSGAVGQVTVQQSSGHEVLDRGAAQLVRKWRFSPARRGNTPIEGWVKVPIQFKLR